MTDPLLPPDEAERLRALHALRILDTPREERFDRLTRMASQILGAPVSALSLVDAERLWFKSAFGAPCDTLQRQFSFCTHAILGRDPLVVPDARADERFRGNPTLEERGGLRAYAGMPVFSEDGHAIGAFCVLDNRPREFTPAQIAALRDLAAIAQDELTNMALNKLLSDSQAARAAAESAARAKSDFLATMSHEIRTPLNGVVGFTSILLGTDLTYQQRDYLLTIQSCGETLVGLINDILDFSKIESGKLDLEEDPVSLRRCVEDVLELNASAAAAKKLELLYEIDPAVPAVVAGDAFRLRQILTNLVNNAVKFTPHGDVAIDVGVERHAAGGECVVRFEVRDTGIGIPAGQVDKLFRAFSQADSSTTRKYGGTGLGLAICKRLVEMMGGEISVQSAPGRGSIFKFTVACRVLPDPPSPPFECLSCVGKRVLVVDDNEAIRRSLLSLLSVWGCEAHALADGEEALALMAREPFDLVLIDHEMRGLDGAALAGRLVRSGGPEASVPRILLAAMGGRDAPPPGDLFRAQVRKPLHEQILLDAVAGALRGGPVAVSSPALAQAQGRPGGPGADGAAPAPTFAALHPLRLLVAEDNPVNQRLILLLLRKLGYVADCAANGAECLAAVARAQARDSYDAVLMDIQMPDMDGHEVTRRLRAQAAEAEGGGRARGPWVIAVTAGAMHGDREKCLQAGMDDYITKPIQPDALRAALERALQAKRAA